jgi:dienelactone hydrolase
MKLYKILCYAFFFLLTSSLQALELSEKSRTWTQKNGQTARAKLVDIVEDKISIEIRRKRHTFPLSDLSEKDREYVQGVMARLPRGKVEKYTATFHKSEHQAFYDEHGMQSLGWRGERGERGESGESGESGEAMPLMMYQPLSEDLEKLPVIIYLQGTGGMGADNTKPFFHCGGGAAKHLLAESFQKKNPCILITPQIERHRGWYCSHFTDPSNEQVWLKNAIRVMATAKEEKYAIDLNRIYIMGHSMGGHGVYDALAKLPDFYAGGVAISAVDDGACFNRDKVKSRMWLFLNKNDKAEGVDVAEKFTRKYKKLGGRIRTKIYDIGGHNAWDTALKDQDFWSVLFKQRRE